MGLSGSESIASSVDNQSSDRNNDSGLTKASLLDELERLRSSKRQNEIKYQLMKKRYEEEASLFSDTRVSHIFKINGALDYLNKLKDLIRIKDESIKKLKDNLEFKNRELSKLQARCSEAEKLSREYQKAWRDSQMARLPEGLDMVKRPSPVARETSRILNRSAANMSSASSFTDSSIPPPPVVDMPAVDEILRVGMTPRDRSSANISSDSTIPPPPEVEVPLDELTSGLGPSPASDRQAFVREQGQLVCHVYATVESVASTHTLSDIIELVECERDQPSTDRAYREWTANADKTSDAKRFHVTLTRGHHAIYYHQIKHILSVIENECKGSSPFTLCLDKLSIFNNHERTKEFLCLATRPDGGQSAEDLARFTELKGKLRGAIDQFANRLTGEDETEDTLAHCSLMSRARPPDQTSETAQEDLAQIERLCEDRLDEEYPICVVIVDKINVRIGNRTYEYSMTAC